MLYSTIQLYNMQKMFVNYIEVFKIKLYRSFKREFDDIFHFGGMCHLEEFFGRDENNH